MRVFHQLSLTRAKRKEEIQRVCQEVLQMRENSQLSTLIDSHETFEHIYFKVDIKSLNMRVHERFRPNESESLNSHQLTIIG